MLSPILLAQSLVYTGVVTTNDTSLSKDELYSRGVLWVSESFKSPGDVIKLSDKENGIIQGSASIKYNHSGMGAGASGHITFILKLYFKKAKYKYEFSDFIHTGISEGWSYGLVNESESNKAGWGKYLQDIKSSINSEITVMLKSLETSMNQNVNSNW
jgi:hypothetical protein